MIFFSNKIHILLFIFYYHLLLHGIIFHDNKMIPFRQTPFFDFHGIITLFRPKKSIIYPIFEIPNWIPAPIPLYNQTKYIPYVKINELVSICDDNYNQSVPDEATLINFINNAVVFKKGQIMTPSFNWHHLYKYYHMKDEKSVDIKQIEHIKQAIYFFHPFHTCYFHFLIETFPLLYSLGDEILRKSVILHNRFMKHQFNELCQILNITFKRSLFVGTPVFVKKLYITTPSFYDGCNPNALRHFRSQILKKLNIFDGIPTTKNLIYNRKNNRFIINFQEMVDALKKELPSYDFTIIPLSKSITDQVKLWRTTRFAMMMHGSTLSNMIFMKPNAIVLEFAKKDCRNTFVMLSRVLGIRLYEIMFRNQTKYFNVYVDLSILIPAVRKIMKILDKGNLI